MDVSLHSPNLSLLAKPFGIALAGAADAQARLTGTWRSPAGRVTLDGTNLALPSNVYVRSVALRAEAGADPDSPIVAALEAQGVALGKETPPTSFAERITGSIKGTRAEHRLEVETAMTREATLRLAMQGGIDARSA